jgi:hypothetical protein
MIFGQRIAEHSSDCALVVDVRQFCATTSGYIHLGESSAGVDKAVVEAVRVLAVDGLHSLEVNA